MEQSIAAADLVETDEKAQQWRGDSEIICLFAAFVDSLELTRGKNRLDLYWSKI